MEINMINEELEAALSGLNVRVTYASPSQYGVLPCVSYYTLTEKSGFGYDNEDIITDALVQIDVWADKGYKCGEIAAEINVIMSTAGYQRQLSMDIPSDGDGVYHRALRYAKSYVN